MFITPPDIPEEVVCRTIKMPNSLLWLGIFNKALATTIQAWNWHQAKDTHLTPDEAVAAAYAVLSDWLEASLNDCEGCVQPGGEPFMRVNPDGSFSQLTEDEWLPPSGDYEVPPVPPREGGTDEDKRCLAAKNAANVLKLMYENITDSISGDLTIAEAIAALIIFLAGILLAPLSLIIAAILQAAAIIFGVVYATAEFVTADYWFEEFNAKLVCALEECADVDGSGVVTFDFDCFNTRLANRVDLTTDYFELVLFGQIQSMLMFIGSDGLNLAGATTAITDDECFCGWTYRWEFTDNDGGFVYDADQSPYNVGTWVDGQGWLVQYTGTANGCGNVYAAGLKSATFDIPSDCSIQVLRLAATNMVSCAHAEMFIGANRTAGLARALKIYVDTGWSTTMLATGIIDDASTGQHVGVEANHNADDLYITAAEISGEGTPPDFTGGSFV